MADLNSHFGPWTAKHEASPHTLNRAAPSSLIPKVLWWNPAWFTFAAAVAMTILGISAITLTEPIGSNHYSHRQIVFLLIGLGAFIVSAVINPKWWRIASYPLAAGAIVLLIIVLLKFMPHWFVRPRNGARRWINLIFLDLQPSELAKIFLIMALANYLRVRKNYRTLRGLLIPFAIMLLPMGLILVEPDLGTAMLFPIVLFAMLIAAGAKIKHISVIVGLGLITVLAIALISLAAASKDPPTYPILEEHQVKRIQGLVNQIKGDQRFAQSINYQSFTAATVTGSGGLTGLGDDRSRVIIRFNRLPFDHNDMIFAVVVNRWGLIGGGVMVGMYLVFILGLVAVAAVTKNPFGRLVCVGFCAVISAQMIINIGMTIGLLPITGMTLPFVSYGGSSLVANFIMTGIGMSIALRPATYFARPSFEFDPKHGPPDPLHRLVIGRPKGS